LVFRENLPASVSSKTQDPQERDDWLLFSIANPGWAGNSWCMKYSLELQAVTRPEWVTTVLANFPAFLQDHADCERKASAMAMSLVAKYPDRVEIIPELIETGIEELEHFQQVYAHMQKRGIRLAQAMIEDPYIKALMNLCHTDPINRFLDRLLLASIIECRGAERFRLVCAALENDLELKEFYHQLWVSEAKHGNIFVKMALNYFASEPVYARLRELNIAEGQIVQRLELRPALH
jgi:tRNA-(ms[2]io[6]A)-hydroxylase